MRSSNKIMHQYIVQERLNSFFIDHQVPVLKHPPRSPDGNLIENLWKVLDDRMRDVEVNTEAEYFEILQ